ncbi:TetR/AcrR family transcriptional regulator [Cellulomonas marina]|uniref:Regulatory protein, tetR family n=1 Tax=Cellulomonas marina TaxID=988821 RepID=A0A1I1B0R7_9CELL|nr:TetR/AcrR family transcriptional regulator [Cellulomonas marina]SFB42258.1 regulatory protein, tetR family [Cellulomonas marina]
MAIHEAAAALVLHQGLEHATIEAIADAAGVSPRTFFNYFPSKDDAVLGMRPPSLDPVLLDGFVIGHDLLDQVSKLLLAVARSSYADGDLVRRQELMHRHPHLGQRRKEYLVEAEELVRQAVAAILATDPGWSVGIEGFDVQETARMLVMVAAVPLRFALTSPAYGTPPGVTPQNLASSLNLFHHVHGKLS